MVFLLLGISGLMMLIGGVFLITQFISIFTRAPFVPTSRAAIAAMIALAEIKPGEKAVDLGSGDGRLVRAAARAGARAEGWEINPFLVFWSRAICRIERLSGSTRFNLGSYISRDFKSADVIFLYVLPSEMKRLAEWLPGALKPGTRIIVNAFPFPGWTPDKIAGSVYRYRIE